MATQVQIDDLLQQIANTNQMIADLDRERGILQGYKATRQKYADLVDQQKPVVDSLVAASETQLRALADKIDVVFP